jgi:hypothetical protein
MIGTLEGVDVANTDQKLGPEDRSHARQATLRTRASGRAKKRCPITSSMLSMRSLRVSTSAASSATMREATSSCAGRVTLWDVAAPSAFLATLSDPLTERFLR